MKSSIAPLPLRHNRRFVAMGWYDGTSQRNGRTNGETAMAEGQQNGGNQALVKTQKPDTGIEAKIVPKNFMLRSDHSGS